MTNTFRRHHKTIMWIIIVGTILSFVYYLFPTARNQNGGGGGSVRSVPAGYIDNEPITQAQFAMAMREAKVAVRMRQGQWPSSQEVSQALPNIAFQQLYIAAKLKELNLDVPLEATALYTRKLFGVPAGQGLPKDKYDDFVKTVLNEQGKVDEDDFYHWVRDQVGAELLIRLYGMNGDLITSKEAEFFFRRDHELMSVELARFSLTNYTAQVVPTAQEIGEFYTNQQADYGLPEREQLNYIYFNLTNYLPAADLALAALTNLDAEIDQTYQANLIKDPAYYKDEAGNPLSAEAAKTKMKADFRLQMLARTAAQTNAMQLTKQFFDERKKGQAITNQLITKAELEKFAASNKLAVVTTPPFDQEHPPQELQIPSAYLGMIRQMKASGSPAFSTNDLKDLPKLVSRLRGQSDPVSAFLWKSLPNPDQVALTNYQPPLSISNQVPAPGSSPVEDAAVQSLNKIIGEPCIYEAERFKDVVLRPETADLMKREPTGQALAWLNRMLLEDAYPVELSKIQPGDPEDQYKLLPATNGLFLLGLERVLPQESQPLEAVRARVIEDCRNSKALELATQAGTNFDAAVQAGLAKGMAFDEICAAQKIKPQTLTPFTIETKSIPEAESQSEFDYLIKRYAYQMPVGQVWPFEQTPAGGFLMFLKARTQVDESVVQKDLPAFLASQREQRQLAAFSIWLGREMQTHVVRPAAKPAAGDAPPPSS